mmetsp:Transcript_29309/g.49295  ORF Transcript_29309/g.49295 Transcript_29309/m.49295 type:complete len:812 (-) Transcript_29309:85-2520(-)
MNFVRMLFTCLLLFQPRFLDAGSPPVGFPGQRLEVSMGDLKSQSYLTSTSKYVRLSAGELSGVGISFDFAGDRDFAASDLLLYVASPLGSIVLAGGAFKSERASWSFWGENAPGHYTDQYETAVRPAASAQRADWLVRLVSEGGTSGGSASWLKVIVWLYFDTALPLVIPSPTHTVSLARAELFGGVGTSVYAAGRGILYGVAIRFNFSLVQSCGPDYLQLKITPPGLDYPPAAIGGFRHAAPVKWSFTGATLSGYYEDVFREVDPQLYGSGQWAMSLTNDDERSVFEGFPSRGIWTNLRLALFFKDVTPTPLVPTPSRVLPPLRTVVAIDTPLELAGEDLTVPVFTRYLSMDLRALSISFYFSRGASQAGVPGDIKVLITDPNGRTVAVGGVLTPNIPRWGMDAGRKLAVSAGVFYRGGAFVRRPLAPSVGWWSFEFINDQQSYDLNGEEIRSVWSNITLSLLHYAGPTYTPSPTHEAKTPTAIPTPNRHIPTITPMHTTTIGGRAVPSLTVPLGNLLIDGVTFLSREFHVPAASSLLAFGVRFNFTSIADSNSAFIRFNFYTSDFSTAQYLPSIWPFYSAAPGLYEASYIPLSTPLRGAAGVWSLEVQGIGAGTSSIGRWDSFTVYLFFSQSNTPATPLHYTPTPSRTRQSVLSPTHKSTILLKSSPSARTPTRRPLIVTLTPSRRPLTPTLLDRRPITPTVSIKSLTITRRPATPTISRRPATPTLSRRPVTLSRRPVSPTLSRRPLTPTRKPITPTQRPATTRTLVNRSLVRTPSPLVRTPIRRDPIGSHHTSSTNTTLPKPSSTLP